MKSLMSHTVPPVPKIEEVRTKSGSCTTATSYSQFFGTVWDIRDFMRKNMNPKQATSDENVEVTVHVDMCLNSEAKVLVYASYRTTTFRNLEGMNYQENCFVPDEFRDGWELAMDNPEVCKGARWCWMDTKNPDEDIVLKLCDGLYERYNVYSISQKRGLAGVPDIKADPEFDSLITTCPAMGSNMGGVPWLMNWKIDVKTCIFTTTVVAENPGVDGYFIVGKIPTVQESFGTAFAYAAYFEIIVTLLVVQTLLKCGYVKTAVRVVPDWA